MTESEDDIYITRIKNGDVHSYTYLVNKYKNMAYTIALKVMKNVEDAEDSAQESFIKAYNQIHTFENNSKFSTWLYTIVYRTAIYNLRKNSINTQQINEETTKNYKTKTTNDLEIKDQQYYVNKAINNLPKMEALLITLFYLNENTVAEIVEITDLSASNIKVKLYRARKKMKKELKDLLQGELNSIL